MATTLVSVENDTVPKVVEFIASKLASSDLAESYKADCKTLAESNESLALIQKLLDQQQVILDLENDRGE